MAAFLAIVKSYIESLKRTLTATIMLGLLRTYAIILVNMVITSVKMVGWLIG